MKRTLQLLSLFLIALLLFPLAVAVAEESVQNENRHVVISFLGDCTIGCDEDGYREGNKRSFVYYEQQYGKEYFFAGLQSVLANDDLTVANLESVLSNSGETRNKKKTYCFRGPTDYVDILKLGSIEAVSFANNHNMDYGPEVAIETTRILEENGIIWFGMSMDNDTMELVDELCKTYIYERDGVKIGFFAICDSTWNKNIQRKTQEHKEAVIALREAGCDLVIACLHGGTEYGIAHDIDKFAKRFLDFGCDIVVGNHPHVVQGIEVCEKGTIVYSLGNCCFGGNTRIHKYAEYGAVVQFDFEFASGEDTTYLGHTMTIYPIVPASLVDNEYADYQPKLVNGTVAEKIMKMIQSDSRPYKRKLNPYVDGVGAVQEFVPNPRLSSTEQ